MTIIPANCAGNTRRPCGEIGFFKIISEGGLGSGIRRIEALTGWGAYRYLSDRDALLTEIARMLKAPPEKSGERLKALQEAQRQLQKKLKQLQQAAAGTNIDDLLKRVDRSLGVPVLSALVEADDMETLRDYLDRLRDKLQSGIILLGTVKDGKALLAAAVTRDLTAKGFHAGRLVGEIAKLTGGGGGGRPDLAQAGGKIRINYLMLYPRYAVIVEKQKAGSGA